MKKLFTIILIATSIIFAGCKKDKYTTEPQISFNSITPNVFTAGGFNTGNGPFLSLQLTDSEGDFGFSEGEDTSYVYVKNISIPPFDIDSFPFPANSAIQRKDLNAEIVVDLFSGAGLLTGTASPPTRPYTDTLNFEVYVKDFGKHKSNVIKAGPLYYITE